MSADPALDQDATAPLVSVCIANYNGIGLVEACVESVRNQVDAPAFEIIVHDDASSDASVAWLRAQPDVRLMESPCNVGFCVSNNRMVEAARGRFILLLNNDAALLPDAIAALLRRSATHGHEAVLGMPQYAMDTGELIDRGCHLDWLLSPSPRRRHCEPPPTLVIGACMWLSRETWAAVGGFPEFFVTNAEDVFLCCAARRLGYNLDITPDSGFRHVLGASQDGGGPDARGGLRLSVLRRYRSERNRLLTMLTFFPWWVLVAVVPANLAILLAECIVVCAVNRDAGLARMPYLRSQLDAFRGLGEALALRRSFADRARTGHAAFLRPLRMVPRKLTLLMESGVPRARR